MIGRLIAYFGRAVLSLRYRISLTGWKEAKRKGRSGILFLPNHPALIDPIIMVTQMHPRFNPAILADRDQVDVPVIRSIAKKMNVIPMADPAVYGDKARAEVEAALQQCSAVLQSGGNVLLYPAGHTCHTRFEELGATSAVETLVRACPDVRIVLMRVKGLWGSRFSRSDGTRPAFFPQFKRGLIDVLANGFLFTPRRKVSIDCCEMEKFPKTGTRTEMNRFMEEFYNRDTGPRTYVPYRFWERGGPKVLPEVEIAASSDDCTDVPEATQALVRDQLCELTGATKFDPALQLARDLGMDSLKKLELLVWIESQFGISAKDPEAVRTVADVMHAAMGIFSSGTLQTLKPVPPLWFKSRAKERVTIPEGKTIPELFLKQAANDPKRAAVADQSSGVLSYERIILAVLVLRKAIKNLDGDRVGILLPPVATAMPVLLAVMVSGKVPVLINWTVGARSLAHALKLSGVKKILTAKALVQRLEGQGTDLSSVKDAFCYLEELAASAGAVAKTVALLKSKLTWGSLRRARVAETAAVLFTSGSESLPKAVPLTHTNIIANLTDSAKVLRLYTDDALVGFLPPFHSFGLTCTFLLPICGGMRAVYHPNPTEGLTIAKSVEAYKSTILPGTPTFLDGITRASTGSELDSVRLAVSGAEKCPAKLYDTIERRWPAMVVCEGYGITECSPIVSVNRPESPHKGTIGAIMPSVIYAIRDIDTGKRVARGEKGMLLVRGPSIFGGYLNYDGASPFEEFEGETWYRTGDLVVENSDGVLTFAGRLKRFVKLGGEMVSLPAIEEVLLKKFQNEDDDVCLAVESTPSETNPEIVLFTVAGITREAANAAIREAGLSGLHSIRIVKAVEKILLLGTGKTDYRALKERLK
jgi:acyl-CoA synthetase (AMP-forming)/AMP-acid ligase II/1-acyl-sn-glycerol-3-phosphate acyltransferase/acyl carrier protein